MVFNICAENLFRSYCAKCRFSHDPALFCFVDHSCGYFSLLPNLIKGYGWNPGKKIYHWFGNALYEQTGNADITFSEVTEF